MRLLIAATTALMMGGAAANAACTVADLEGQWTINQTNRAEICGIIVDDEGEIEGTCRTYKNGKAQTSDRVEGKISINGRCTVRGRISVDDKTRSFGGKSDADMTMIAGVFFRYSGFIAYRND